MTQDVCQIVQLALGTIVAGLYVYKKITGKDVLRHVMLSRPVIKSLGVAVEAVYKMWPEKAVLKTVYIIMNAAIEGAEIAEKAWQMGNLEDDERNAYAKKLVKETLGKADIIVTPQIDMIVNGIIEAVCMILPHQNKTPVVPVIVGEAE